MKKKILIVLSLIWYHCCNLCTVAATPTENFNRDSAENKAVNFVAQKLTDEHGLIRSAIEFGKPGDTALSESIGQIMLYAALTGDQNLWHLYQPQAEKYFWQDGYYAWRINLTTLQPDNTSALVDDLRLAKAYLTQEKKNGGYRDKIAALSDGLLAKSVDARGNISDFYDSGSGAADHVSLFYLDTEVMKEFAAYDPAWKNVQTRCKNILLAMPANEQGFFPKSYYFADDKFVWGQEIVMVENLYTALFAARVGRDTSDFADFLRRELAKGKICNRYQKDGEPSFPHDSVAVYALTARYFFELGDYVNAKTAYEKMMSFFISGGKLSEGFGYRILGTVYAFDQLEAILAMAKLKDKL